jgi:SAM-dependent methyltransferase
MTVPSDWYKTFFTGVALAFWDAVTSEEMTRAETAFLAKTLHLRPGAAVLDVPCGSGRHALALAARGHRLTGVDIAPENIARAKSTAAARQLAVEWHEADMRELPWTDTFDAAYCMGNSFGYLDDDGNAAFLRAVARALKPGARFLIDTGIVAEALLPTLEERTWFEFGGITMLIQNDYNHAASRLETELTFIREGKTEKHLIAQRIYTYRELIQLLADSGLTHAEAYSSLTGEPFRLKAPRVLLVTSKWAK